MTSYDFSRSDPKQAQAAPGGCTTPSAQNYGFWACLSSATTHAGRSSVREEARQRQRHTQAGREHDEADAERDERGRARQPRRRARALLADRARRRAYTQASAAALRRKTAASSPSSGAELMQGVRQHIASGRFRGNKRDPRDACHARRNRPFRRDEAQQGPAHCPANTSTASATTLKGLEASRRSAGCPLAFGCARGAGASLADDRRMPAAVTDMAHDSGRPLHGRAARTDHRRVAAHRRDGAQHERDDVRERGELGRQRQRRHNDEQRVRLRPACGLLSAHRARLSLALMLTEPYGSGTEVASAACWCNQAKCISCKRRWGVLSSVPSVSLDRTPASLLSVQTAWRRLHPDT
jgi:hypothetical protein